MQRVKHTRNQNACDICRSRRIKCRFSQETEVCDGCRFLGVECTNVRPRRKRGPPNRHAVRAAEARQAGLSPSPAGQTPGALQSISPSSAISRSVSSNTSLNIPPNVSLTISPFDSTPLHAPSPNKIAPPPHIVPLPPPSLLPSSDPDILTLLAPLPLIHTVLNDWFTHIHPLAPILHQKSFLKRLHTHTHTHTHPPNHPPTQHANSSPKQSRIFTGLVISILAATCATLRRKSFAEYHPITLERCKQLIITYDLLPSDGPYCLDWCIAKYNLGTAATAYGDLSDPWIWRVLGESMTGTMWMMSFGMEGMERTERELLRRLYCLLVICQIALNMIGYQPMGRLAFDSATAILQSLPQPLTEHDLGLDLDLEPTPSPVPSLARLPPGTGTDNDKVTYVPGLTHLLQIFLTWHTCQTDRFYHPPLQVLSTGLSRIRSTIDSLPPELRWRGGMSRPRNATRGHDIQIANIFITSLYVRSNLLQQFGAEGVREREHEEEHQSIVSDLLEVLYHLPQTILEANGYSLIPKIRDIGAAYLEVLQGGADVVAIDDEAKERLERLLRKLGVLDFRPDLATNAV
ncbi:hypothetical protein BJX66DRAFT_227254 [Aspergillus keveii]|uniref:Zn(2)-C6 fungal-type domain-containing protein n=1 Tax=Aspergillus keveii TaxID=714993 RepID=A0ABR4G2W1_9EURO